MLIMTLPTLRSAADLTRVEAMLRHPLAGAARYNTGGASPYPPREIVRALALIAKRYGKPLYFDLEGRQVRVARWSPQSSGVVTLNRDFSLTLPARIFFRRAGWFDIVDAEPAKRKVFFVPQRTRGEYYLGESQSVHIVAEDFSVRGYLSWQDRRYIRAAARTGLSRFMLSFVEQDDDIGEVLEVYRSSARFDAPPKLVAKVESLRGLEWVVESQARAASDVRLMAARDDLFLALVDRRALMLEALRFIVDEDPGAIVASRLLSGFESSGEVTLADMADIALMAQYGYRHFMLSDEFADRFDEALEEWQKVIAPLLGETEQPFR